jgi:hypothetical protein
MYHLSRCIGSDNGMTLLPEPICVMARTAVDLENAEWRRGCELLLQKMMYAFALKRPDTRMGEPGIVTGSGHVE